MNFKSLILIILFLGVTMAGFSQQAGYLDETFGNNGLVVTNLYDDDDLEGGMAVHADGKIVVGGSYYGSDVDFIFAQYQEDGTLDPDFSDDGMLRLNYPGTDDYINDVVVQDDEKILALGFTGNSDAFDFAVVRLNEDGTPDNTFSNDGVTTIDFGVYDFGRAIALQEDGKIILVGYTCDSDNENYDLAMCRLNENGTLDNTFGSNGRVVYDVNWESEDYMNDVVVYNGNIYVSGYCYYFSSTRDGDGVAVMKFDESGNVDNSFGDNGLAFMELNTVYQVYAPGSRIAINQNGIYVAASRTEGWNVSDMALISFLHNGYPNDDFGDHGIVITEMIGNSTANSILLQPDDKIVVGGFHVNGNDEKDFCIARFLETGVLDDSFGDHYGVTFVDVSPGGYDYINDISLQTDNKIVAAGTAVFDYGREDDFALARFYSGLEVGVPETDNSLFDQVKVINPVKDHTLLMDINLPESSTIVAKLFTVDGKSSGRLFSRVFDKGTHRQRVKLDSGLPSGIYVLQVGVNGKQKSYKLVIN